MQSRYNSAIVQRLLFGFRLEGNALHSCIHTLFFRFFPLRKQV